jgi:hypothetical protein
MSSECHEAVAFAPESKRILRPFRNKAHLFAGFLSLTSCVTAQEQGAGDGVVESQSQASAIKQSIDSQDQKPSPAPLKSPKALATTSKTPKTSNSGGPSKVAENPKPKATELKGSATESKMAESTTGDGDGTIPQTESKTAEAEPQEETLGPTVADPTCQTPELKNPRHGRKEIYAGQPFQPGEEATYEVSYMGLHAGYGTISVATPLMHKGDWHRVFTGQASTGDWYSAVFIVKDKITAISRPFDFGISRFYLEQDEGKIFGSRYARKKWIEFDHGNCKAFEKIQMQDKPEENKVNEFNRGNIDALGAYFYLRTLDYEIGKLVTAPVYTSEKNWTLEAQPVAHEVVEVPAGRFETVKLKLQTYLGQELQQKGDIYMWIAIDREERQMVQMQGEIKIGSIWIRLKTFKAGRPL